MVSPPFPALALAVIPAALHAFPAFRVFALDPRAGSGPALACRRRALDACTIRIVRQLVEQLGGGSAFGPPKSRAGRRTVTFSDIIKADLADHLERLGSDDDQALVFTSPMGTPLRHSNFYRRAWLPAVAKAGLPGIHFHDLRHAGNTLTADAGASLRELDRMGHSSTRAALIYQHSSDERQRKLADAIGQAARAALLKTATASGTHVARETGSHP